MSLAKRPRFAPPEPQPSLLEQLYDRGLAGKIPDDACDPFPSWSGLPLEVLVHVFGFLTPQERRRYMVVCRQWYRAMSIPSLWRRSWVSIRSGLASKPPQLQALIQQRKPFGVKLLYSHSDLEKLHELHPHLQGLHLTFKYTLQCPLNSLLSFSDLKVLKLESNDSTPLISVSTLPLERLGYLKELYFINIPIFVFHSTFPSHSTLSHLVLNKCGSLSPSFTCSLLDLLPQLTSLHITHSSYYHGFIHSRPSVRNSKPVVDGADITSLSLYNTSFNGCDTVLHRRLLCLRKLDLSYCQQDGDQLRHLLVPLSHLEELNLTANKCTDSVLASLTCSNLKSIELAANGDVTLRGIRSLSQLAGSHLQYLGVSCCVGVLREREEFFHNLPTLLPSLKTLDLYLWKFNRREFEQLTKLAHLLGSDCHIKTSYS